MKQGPEKNFSGREGFRTQGSPALCVGELSACQRTYDLAPSFMRGVAEGRGEPEYLHSKYSEIPTFLRKVGTSSDLASLGHLPHEWGRQELF